jgi:hypothetical protein
MAIIDHELEHKIRLVKKELEKSSPHIKWYVDYLNGIIEERNNKISEYHKFFETMNRFLPNR